MSWVKQSDENRPPETGERSANELSPKDGGPSTGRLDRKIVLVELDASMPSDVVLQHCNGGVEVAIAGIRVGEQYVRIRRYHEGASHIARRFLAHSRNEHGLAFMRKAIANDSFYGSHGQVIKDLNVFGSEIANDHLSGHQASLSVDGAPIGAGVGTYESTEGDQAPVLPVMKMPSAVAAAEGDETKHSNGK